MNKDKKKELREKAKKNGKTLSVVLRDLIDEYIAKKKHLLVLLLFCC